ncbi:MAG: DUF2892 domain-containing protein [Chloroflexota bacterium]
MTFTTNESPLDRAIRIVLGVALAAAAIGGVVAAPWLYAVLAIAAILLGTGVVGFCPLYAILHISTTSTAR